MRLGFVGCGFMGQLAHLANYAKLPEVELAALADLRPNTATAVAKKFGIPRVYKSHGEMLQEAELDAVVAVMNFSLHHAVVPDILNAGLHVLTEKPAAVCSQTARRSAAIAAEKGLVYHLGYMKRCDQTSIRMRNLIREWKASGQQGKLQYLRVTMPPGDWLKGIEGPIAMEEEVDVKLPDLESPPEWMTDELGGKYIAFINFYIHQVNLIRFLLDEDFDIDHVDTDERLLFARSSSGVTILLEMNTHTLQDDWMEEYVAHFERGKITMNLPAPMDRQTSGSLEIYRHCETGSVVERPRVGGSWSMLEQAKCFVEEVRGMRENVSPAEEAVRDLLIAEAYIRLLKKGNGK